MSHRTKSHLPPNVGQWEDLNSQHQLFPADKNQRDKVRGKIYMVMLIKKVGNDRKSKGQILLSAWVINTPGQQYGFAEFGVAADKNELTFTPKLIAGKEMREDQETLWTTVRQHSIEFMFMERHVVANYYTNTPWDHLHLSNKLYTWFDFTAACIEAGHFTEEVTYEYMERFIAPVSTPSKMGTKGKTTTKKLSGSKTPAQDRLNSRRESLFAEGQPRDTTSPSTSAQETTEADHSQVAATVAKVMKLAETTSDQSQRNVRDLVALVATQCTPSPKRILSRTYSEAVAEEPTRSSSVASVDSNSSAYTNANMSSSQPEPLTGHELDTSPLGKSYRTKEDEVADLFDHVATIQEDDPTYGALYRTIAECQATQIKLLKNELTNAQREVRLAANQAEERRATESLSSAVTEVTSAVATKVSTVMKESTKAIDKSTKELMEKSAEKVATMTAEAIKTAITSNIATEVVKKIEESRSNALMTKNLSRVASALDASTITPNQNLEELVGRAVATAVPEVIDVETLNCALKETSQSLASMESQVAKTTIEMDEVKTMANQLKEVAEVTNKILDVTETKVLPEAKGAKAVSSSIQSSLLAVGLITPSRSLKAAAAVNENTQRRGDATTEDSPPPLERHSSVRAPFKAPGRVKQQQQTQDLRQTLKNKRDDARQQQGLFNANINSTSQHHNISLSSDEETTQEEQAHNLEINVNEKGRSVHKHQQDELLLIDLEEPQNLSSPTTMETATIKTEPFSRPMPVETPRAAKRERNAPPTQEDDRATNTQTRQSRQPSKSLMPGQKHHRLSRSVPTNIDFSKPPPPYNPLKPPPKIQKPLVKPMAQQSQDLNLGPQTSYRRATQTLNKSDTLTKSQELNPPKYARTDKPAQQQPHYQMQHLQPQTLQPMTPPMQLGYRFGVTQHGGTRDQYSRATPSTGTPTKIDQAKTNPATMSEDQLREYVAKLEATVNKNRPQVNPTTLDTEETDPYYQTMAMEEGLGPL